MIGRNLKSMSLKGLCDRYAFVSKYHKICKNFLRQKAHSVIKDIFENNAHFCGICDKDEASVKLDVCGHIFHTKCFNKNVSMSTSSMGIHLVCPLCETLSEIKSTTRSSFRAKEQQEALEEEEEEEEKDVVNSLNNMTSTLSPLIKRKRKRKGYQDMKVQEKKVKKGEKTGNMAMMDALKLRILELQSQQPLLDCSIELFERFGVGLRATRRIKKGTKIASMPSVVHPARYDMFSTMYQLEVNSENNLCGVPNMGAMLEQINHYWDNIGHKAGKMVPYWACFANEPVPGKVRNAHIRIPKKRKSEEEGERVVPFLVASKNIKVNEEITWCYGNEYERGAYV